MPARLLADSAAYPDHTLAPGSLQRVLRMAALRADGRSLDEIAARFGVSRERVRQILRAQGREPGPHEVAAARRRRAEEQAEDHVDELLVSWRAGDDPTLLADRLDLHPGACRSTIERFATAVDRAARRSSLARRGAATTIAAGWQAGNATTRARQRRWTADACWEALVRAANELGEAPSVLAYERYAAGRDDLPSSATVRNRLGRWSSLTARLTAQRELAEQSQTRVRAVHRALARA